ncbi:MAG: right-handed parallel beta-helix repeat-containing protein [Patescibacteria group bacterium]
MKNRKFSNFYLIIFFVLFFLVFASSIQAKTYYISPDGSDDNSGTKESPWATPGYASRQLNKGDDLIILGGTYYLNQYDDDIIMPSSGKKKNWTIIKGEKGNRPVLAGGDNLMTAIDISGKKYIKLKNIEITNNNGENFREGISGAGEPMNNIKIENLYIHHIDEFGIDLQDINHLLIKNTKIKYTGFGAIGSPAGEHGGWKNVTIRNSRLSYSGHYYQGENKIGPYDRPDGFGIEDSEGPIYIIKTYANHNKGDGLDSKAKNTFINKCIVANNYADGVKLWHGDSEIRNTLIYGRGDGNTITSPWSPIVIGSDNANDIFKIKNVTVDDAVGNNYVIHVQYDDPNTPITLVMKNNIFSSRGANNSPVYIGSAVNAKIKNNLFYLPNSDRILDYGSNSYTSNQIDNFGKNNIYGNPLFKQTAFGSKGNYYLKKNSPAIDKGMRKGAPKHDIRSKKRPKGKQVDIGAYERIK